MTLNNSSQVSLKSNRSTVADNASHANGSFAFYSQPIPSFNGGGGSNGVAGVNNGNTSHIAKIYGGQVQSQLPQQPPLFLQQHYHQQQPQQQQQQQQQAYGGVYGTPSTSSVASRRLTAGDIASSAYQHGSRKNATSMFMAG
jgi:hypothetical protein